ncbi:LysR family transcriptional regulator [Caproiciproducens sp. NJN-50]|uniref:LysR family transcriptional regulator n=1 Tax=Acutalibacteraceae TaxID=3082771 RepID=UPI000FFE011F|nr:MULTISPECIES: LysR family transcriptional regulator [Acutalibacteraceae]QAT48952.1 LysR family transcriptional regulator [Caproiciproducens sp. NJN-50]
MNLSQLYYFKKLAEVQHYTKAAKELYITQPSLSEAISSLESELGVRLFLKNGRNIRLTQYGQEFYQYVSASLNELDKGVNVIQEQVKDIGGTIEIGCIATLLVGFMARAMYSYRESVSEKTVFHVFETPTAVAIEGLKSEIYDIAFCSKVEDPDLRFTPILEQEILALVNQQHPLAKCETITLRDLAGYNLITYRPDIQIGRDVGTLLAENGLKAEQPFMEEGSIGASVQMNPIVGIVANTVWLSQYPNLVRIHFSDVPRGFRKVCMAYNSKHFINRPTERFMDFVLSHLDTLVSEEYRLENG